MQRFRSRKKTRADPSEGAGRVAPTVPVLLEPQDFRQSMILLVRPSDWGTPLTAQPHLTSRFKLLRDEDGVLVSPERMKAHLTAQHQGGRLTTVEMDAVLQQYRMQVGYERPAEARLSPPGARGDRFLAERWSTGEDGLDPLRTASMVSATTYESGYAPSTFTGRSSAVGPFPYDSSPPSESPVPVTSATFRRGGNSMFGGRVKTMAQLKMVKSPSSHSIKSRAGTDDPVEEDTGATNDAGGQSGSDGADSTAVGMSSQPSVDSLAEEDDDDEEQEKISEPHAQGQTVKLTQNQLNRISRVLDDYETSLLSFSHRRISTRSSAVPLSPTHSDTEPIDPHYHRLAPSAPSTESVASNSPTRTLTAPSAPGPPGSGKTSPVSLRSAYPVASGSRQPSLTSISSDAPAARAYSFQERRRRSQSTAEEDHASLASSTGTPISPYASTFPAVPARSDVHDTSDDGPFDLTYTPASSGSRGWSRPRASQASAYQPLDSALVAPSAASARHRASASSHGSSGSSYHAVGDESEDDGGLSRAKIPEPVSEDDEQRVMDSDALIKDLQQRESGGGAVDVALEDLVLIQERLVRSASRRAASRLGAATPTSVKESERGTARSPSLHAGSLRRAGSILAGEESVSTSRAASIAGVQTTSSTSDGLQQSSSGAPASRLDGEAGLDSPSLDHAEYPRTLGAPVQLEPPPNLRESRTRRDPSATTSMLVRDVRNQANAATMALRKGAPLSPGQPRLVKTKSVRHANISAPQFIFGPTDIPAVPIIPLPHQQLSQQPPSHFSPEAADSRKPKQGGIGFRFKMLVKNGSRDNSFPNGDEVTPFIDFENDDTTPPLTTPPFTPPSADSPSFATTSRQPHGLEFTPGSISTEYPHTPETRSMFPTSTFSSPMDFYKSPAELKRVAAEEGLEKKSPSGSLTRLVTRLRRNRNHSVEPLPLLDSSTRLSAGSGISGGKMSLSQFDDNLALDTTKVITLPRHQFTPDSADSSPISSRPETATGERGAPGVGSSPISFGVPERMAVSYDVTASRRGRAFAPSAVSSDALHEFDEPIPSTAPLAVVKSVSPPPGTPPLSAPLPALVRLHRDDPQRGSVASMNELWKVAHDLGLEGEGIKDFVKAGYGGRASRVPGRTPFSPPDLELLPSQRTGKTEGEDSSLLELPLSSPTGGSVISFRSSGYAGSVFDLYDGEAEDGEETPTGPTAAGQAERASEPHEGGAVYTVLSDLRKDTRDSDQFSPTSDTFRPDSFDSFAEANLTRAAAGASGRKVEDFQALVSRHRRNQSSLSTTNSSPASISTLGNSINPSSFARPPRPSLPDDQPNRYPSIYVRDEHRLQSLQNGVAESDEGLFLVRPKVAGGAGFI